MSNARTTEAYRIGEAVTDFVATLEPIQSRYGAVAEAWSELLPVGLRAHCRIAGLSDGCLRVAADSPSYLYELQVSKAALLAALQQACPAARLRRIDVRIGRR